MDFVEFWAHFDRMHRIFSEEAKASRCDGCYFAGRAQFINSTSMKSECRIWAAEYPKKAEELLERFKREHPIITNKDAYYGVVNEKPWQAYAVVCQEVKEATGCSKETPCKACGWWYAEAENIEIPKEESADGKAEL